VVSVRGSVVDIRFDKHSPPIYSLLHAKEGEIAIEVLAQLDAHRVRGIALTPTQGLARGIAVEDTGGPLKAPVPDGSITDMMVSLKKDVTSEQANAAMRKASEKPPLQGILRVTDEALVSQDIIGDPHSSIVDAQSTMVLNNRIVKILSWYDNEWGYSARLVDFAEFMAGKGLTMEKA